MAGLLNVTVDTAEPRIQRDRIVMLADGYDWDVAKTADAGGFVDGVTRTGMLCPLYKTEEWATTTTGAYARLKKADYTFYNPPFEAQGTPPPYPLGAPSDAKKWLEDDVNVTGNTYLVGQGVNDMAVTNATYPKNRSFLLSWFSFNAGQTSAVQVECGWLSDTMAILLRFWTDGKAEIYKNGILVGEGNIFEHKVTSQTLYGKTRYSQHRRPKKASRGDASQQASKFIDLMLIPCRRRDLLLLSSVGGGFRFTFADLDPDNPDNTIVPDNARFFWRVPEGQSKIQLAPLNFLTEGKIISEQRVSRLAPNADEDPELTVYRDYPGYGTGTYAASIMEPDLSAPFTPDGTKNKCRLQVDLTGDGMSSPWIYGTSAVYDAITADTDDTQAFDFTDYILTSQLSVPANPADVKYTATLKSPEELDEIGAAAITSIGNRPGECAIGSISFLTGRSGAPKWREAPSDLAQRLMLEHRDRCVAMEEYRIKEALPVDGLELADGLALFAKLPGYSDDDIDIPQFGFNLPTIGQSSEGEWALLPEVGDKAIDWFDRLWKTFARHTEWGWIPTAAGTKLQMRELDWLEAQPSQLTLYSRIEDAINAGWDRDVAAFYVYRSAEHQTVLCEANDIWVTGRDPRTAKPFWSHWQDEASMKPDTPPDQRPGNWLGEPREYAFIDTSLTKLEKTNWVAATLARRLAPRREIVPFETFFQFRDDDAPIWRGDKLTLDGIGDVRITAFNSTMANETEFGLWRPTTYTGEICYTSAV